MTEDIVAARDTPIAFTASVQGRMPESASLVLTRRSPGDANDANTLTERFEVRPAVDSQGNVTLTTTRSFDSVGSLTYRFEAEGVSSDTHTIRVCEPPSIKSMTATVSLPQGHNRPAAVPYVQQIKDGTLEVLAHSLVELEVACTAPLREASITMPGREPAVQNLGGTDSFRLQFPADAASSVEIKLTSTDGIANREPQQLRVVLKSDAPPQFKLLCPEGDCLATDVASIPIAFEVTDDFGLESVQLYCELPGGGPTLLDSKTAQGAKSTTLTHTLELEQYDVRIGDSILFYARAVDIDTDQKTTDANHCSEVYFIEVRPYRQYWHRQRMLERLEAAKRLLQDRANPQWSTVPGGGASNGTLVYTKGGPTTPAETARMLSREFWSLAIEARQKELQPFVEQPSDIEFFQAEKEFFEKAAQFKQPRVEK